MNNEEKILQILAQMQTDIAGLKQGQASMLVVQAGMQSDISGLKQGQADMLADIDQIKEDTAVTREAVNALGEWVEVASDVLKISYPLKKAE